MPNFDQELFINHCKISIVAQNGFNLRSFFVPLTYLGHNFFKENPKLMQSKMMAFLTCRACPNRILPWGHSPMSDVRELSRLT